MIESKLKTPTGICPVETSKQTNKAVMRPEIELD